MAPRPTTLADLATTVRARAAAARPPRALLVGLSGIDGCGKGWVAARLDGALGALGLRTALINVDGWLNLPHRRFAERDPAGHFYEHALRLDELFDRLILPLCRNRTVRLTADFAEETATAYRPHRYEFSGVDVVLLEGIYLFKRAYRPHFDVAVWIDCAFETALGRAIARAQEGLAPDATVRAYETIYFPAQRIHFERDEPLARADYVLDNGATEPSVIR